MSDEKKAFGCRQRSSPRWGIHIFFSCTVRENQYSVRKLRGCASTRFRFAREEEMIKGVLLDLSGTLHVGDTPIPGALAAVRRLEEAGVPLRFVTNTSRKTRKMLHDDLKRMGFT